jgi:hypothetical protein
MTAWLQLSQWRMWKKAGSHRFRRQNQAFTCVTGKEPLSCSFNNCSSVFYICGICSFKMQLEMYVSVNVSHRCESHNCLRPI